LLAICLPSWRGPPAAPKGVLPMPAYSAPLPFKVGDILTDYASVEIVVRDIATGGFGIVAFGPNQENRGQWAALKMIKPEVLRRGKHIRELFIREGLTWRGVWPHANVMQAQFVTEINGLPCLVLDYAAQGALRRHMYRDLPVDLAFTWAQHIAAGMAHLHTPDPEHLRLDPIIHRDLKPENILIDGDGFACITDFGLAKTQAAVAQVEALGAEYEAAEEETAQDNTRSQQYHTRRGVSMGTPAYMAPEQWADAATAGPAADVYAFGLILGELLGGQHPILPLNERHTQEEWRAAHLSGQHRPLPTVFPLPLQNLYGAMLALDPAQRPIMAEVFSRLQATSRGLRLSVYDVPAAFPPTVENRAVFWIGWSNAYDRFGLYAEALVRSDQAYALLPHEAPVLSGRADILAHLGRPEEALAMYVDALASLPTDSHQRRNIVLNQQGNLLATMHRCAEADAAYAAALQESPGAADTWYNRAVNLRQWGEQAKSDGDVQQARDHFRQAFDCARESSRLNPNLQPTPGLLARIGARLNESQLYADAEAAYALALQGELDQDAPATWYNRAVNQRLWGIEEVQATQTATGREHLQAALQYATEAQRLGLDVPQLPRLINAIRQALQQEMGHDS
jgi:serine/threonine protein kinase